jgi:hypothetical protein
VESYHDVRLCEPVNDAKQVGAWAQPVGFLSLKPEGSLVQTPRVGFQYLVVKCRKSKIIFLPCRTSLFGFN